MKHKVNLIYYIPALLVLLVHLGVIAINYSHLPSQIPSKIYHGEVLETMDKSAIWLIWGWSVIVCVLMAISVHIPLLRKNSFRIRLGRKSIVNMEEIMSPKQVDLLYAVMAFMLTLIFLVSTCIILSPNSLVFPVLFCILAGILIVGIVVITIILTIKARRQ